MPQLPEAFLIYRAELKRIELEKEELRKRYDEKITLLNNELKYLKEQIQAQQDMLKTSFDYAARLEKEMQSFREQVARDRVGLKKSFH